MTVGILLLSNDNQYLKADGSLPRRPEFDKGLLEALMKDEAVWCTRTTWDSMPKRMKKLCKSYKIWDHTLNLGIATMYSNPPKLLLVVRSTEQFTGGKKFDLGQWTLMVKQPNLDIYISK